MKYGLTDKTLKAIRNCIARHPQIEKAILYDSRTMGTYRNGSDIDITLVGEQLDVSLLFKIENELDELNLPYKMDVSVFHQIDNRDLTDHIERVGELIYEKEGTTR